MEDKMECGKCGFKWMHRDYDSRHSIEAYTCLICGNRLYPGYPKRYGRTEQKVWETENILKVIHGTSSDC
jgi:hypothetical protein